MSLQASGRRDIGLKEGAIAAQFLVECLQFLEVAIGERQIGALGMEGASGGAADAAGRADDQNGLAASRPQYQSLSCPLNSTIELPPSTTIIAPVT